MPLVIIPYLAAVLVSFFNFKSKKAEQQNNTNSTPNGGGVSIVQIILGVIVFFLVRNYVKEQEKQTAQDEVFNPPQGDNSASQAARFYQALDPSDFKIFNQVFGPDDYEQIKALAIEVTNLSKVSDKYKSLYSRNLLADLQEILGVTKYNEFMRLYASKINPSKTTTTKRPLKILASSTLNIFTLGAYRKESDSYTLNYIKNSQRLTNEICGDFIQNTLINKQIAIKLKTPDGTVGYVWQKQAKTG